MLPVAVGQIDPELYYLLGCKNVAFLFADGEGQHQAWGIAGVESPRGAADAG